MSWFWWIPPPLRAPGITGTPSSVNIQVKKTFLSQEHALAPDALSRAGGQSDWASVGWPPGDSCYHGLPGARGGTAPARFKDEEVRQLCQQTEVDPCLGRIENEGLPKSFSQWGCHLKPASVNTSLCYKHPRSLPLPLVSAITMKWDIWEWDL